MSEAVMRKHIDLYVNDYSINLGDAGKDAIQKMLTVFQNTHTLYKMPVTDIFLNAEI